jgi:hypothetical protein
VLLARQLALDAVPGGRLVAAARLAIDRVHEALALALARQPHTRRAPLGRIDGLVAECLAPLIQGAADQRVHRQPGELRRRNQQPARQQ